MSMDGFWTLVYIVEKIKKFLNKIFGKKGK